MVAVYALFTHPFPSSSSDSLFSFPPSPQPTAYFSPPTLSTFRNHEWFSLLKFTRTPRAEPKSMLTQVGLRPDQRILIQCRYISSATNALAEIGMLFSFFQEIGIEEEEAQVVLDKNPALTSTSLDLLRTRILSFRSVGVDGLELCRLITKCPSLLTAEEIDAFLHFVRHDFEGKIEPPQLNRLFVRLLLHRGVPREKIFDVLNKLNLYKALCLKSVEEIERTITFLSRFGGIDLIVRRPTLLNYDLDTQLVPRVGFLTELSGGDEDATGTLLGKLPAILSYTVDHTKGHVELLRSLAGLTDEQIFKFLLVFPNVVSASRERKLRPRIHFLKQCGLSSNDIYKFLIKAPLFLGLSFEDNLAYKLAFLVKIGYKYRTKDMAAAMGSATRTSCDNLQKVIGLFLSHGLSCGDIVIMSTKHPQILQYSHSAIEKKMEYLINEIGREVGELLNFPAFLGYKLDDRIKARYELRKKVLGEGMSLNKLLTVSSERFSTKKPAYVVENENLNEEMKVLSDK
ncbi:transcription termination factor MTERF8 chloroplastic [Prunus yedoensis var. nudiflora]|uniref:Transcription termination factor MTERF8 chloroplastic n=1 Tax=Prunus yedoensis var. nudiflora TaxID=2094558 RepID=A0A314YH48_PRUYE|nr:transcription termination factor MTERF8 chloroplastic [Prunus yedoensis var. nudiflora]PQQ04429.1 transcription termination factor MTERF8 chloroplastic [Prunus yedoensis var. nudiflora]